MNWQIPNFSQLEILQKSAFNNKFFANNYSAVNSILYQKKFNSKIALQDGWIFERYEHDGKFCFSFPHNIEGHTEKIDTALELLFEESKAAGSSLLFHNITITEKVILEKHFPEAKITQTPEYSDYIYLTENLAKLAGKKFSKKRNHIHQFENKYPAFEFEPLSDKNYAEVLKIEEKWLTENSEFALETGTMQDLLAEKEIIHTAIQNFADFSKICGLTGGILYVFSADRTGREGIAFCLASVLSDKITDIHFEKCIAPFAHDGGYAVINQEFAKTVKTCYINREEDLGIEGLKKAKLSYYPEQILEKFFAEI